MATLHLINHQHAMTDCLAVAAADDAILLLEDGVYAAAVGLAPQRPLHALAADVHARGLSGRIAAQVAVVSDAQFVELVTGHVPIVTWR